eukprot:TRINITY_DN5358_c0_g4_i1.p1 TRINITY_DN5358_c0_g4~~TRINITY_DN5358_c0_g4_i1.p1  ORF type:complete len:598 (+),score=83.29 TRINITY_DN5358_c0_g4_i1:189-1982(+)
MSDEIGQAVAPAGLDHGLGNKTASVRHYDHLVVAELSFVNLRIIRDSGTHNEGIALLRKFVSCLDAILAKHPGIFRVDAVVEKCMFVIATDRAHRDCSELVNVCFALIQASRCSRTSRGVELGLRVGIHAGSATCLRVASSKSRPVIFGCAVDGACSCERVGISNCIQLSRPAFRHLQSVLVEDMLPAGSRFVQREHVDMGEGFSVVPAWLVVPAWIDKQTLHHLMCSKPVGGTIDVLETMRTSAEITPVTGDETRIVLSVSDNSVQQELIQEIFSSYGFTILIAMSGVALFGYLKEIEQGGQIAPHVVLIDECVQGTSGTSLSLALRKSFGMAELGIIWIASSSASGVGTRESMPSCCNAFVTVPFQAEELVARARCLSDVCLSHRALRQVVQSSKSSSCADVRTPTARSMHCSSQTLMSIASLGSFLEVVDENQIEEEEDEEEKDDVGGLRAVSCLENGAADSKSVDVAVRMAANCERSSGDLSQTGTSGVAWTNKGQSFCQQPESFESHRDGSQGGTTKGDNCGREALVCSELLRLSKARLQQEKVLWDCRNQLAARKAALTVSKDEVVAVHGMVHAALKHPSGAGPRQETTPV